MKKRLNTLMAALILIMAVALSGCATTQDVDRLEGEVQTANDRAAAAQASADEAKREAAAARAAAERAEQAAMDAKAAAEATNQKIDNMFKKTMQK